MSTQILGRGKIYFDPFIAGTETVTGEDYFGNTPSFSLSAESQKLDHYNADEGVKVKDNSVTLETNYSGSLTTDIISPENVARFFMGEHQTLSQIAETGTVETLTVKKGRFYQLGRSPSLISGKRNVTVTTVEDTGGVGTTYVEDTDYVVHSMTGRIEILESGAIADDADLDVTYDVAEHSREQVISGTDQLYGALRFVAYNAAGPQNDYYMPKVSLAPSGEFALKGDEWQQISLQVEILQLGTNPHILMDGRPFTP